MWINEATNGSILKGWYFNDGKKLEYFIISDQVRKTDKFIQSILKECNIPVNVRSIAYLKQYLTPANYEIKKAGNYSYVNIFGDTFGGFGDENTIVIDLRNT